VVVVDRHLADAVREGHRQLAARVDLAEHHVGDRRTALDAGEPRLEDGWRGFHDVLEREWPAVEEHHHQRLARRRDRLDQLLLASREIERAARVRLAAHLPRLTERENHLVGGLRDRHCLREAGVEAAVFRVGVGTSVLESLQPSA
jgi:hypothetical protein